MKLYEIGTIITGNTPSKKNDEYYGSDDIMFIKPSDIDEKYITNLEKSEGYISEKARNKVRILPKDTVLVTCIGTIGKVGILEKEGTCNQQINAIIPNDMIVSKYLAYLIKSKQKILQLKANAPVVPIINKTDFSKIEINICDIKEQKRIVEKLDLVKKIIDIRQEQLGELNNIVKSQFVEMFGIPFLNNKNWTMGIIKELVREVKYGTSKPANGGKYKYLRMNNITYEGKLDLNEMKYIDIEKEDKEKYVTKKGDILFNRTNSKELVGKTCVFDVEEEMIIAGFIIRVRVNDFANPYFISEYLNTVYLKDKLRNMCKDASGQSNINAKELQNIKIYIPPITLQNQFSEIVKQIDKQKFEIEKSLKETQGLYESLMEKYFG